MSYLPTSELQIFYWAAGALLAANLLAMALFVLYAKLPNGRFRGQIQYTIYHLDRFADNMENEQKRRSAIQQVNEVLGWRKILIPSALIGWIIDVEVAAIRRMQQVTEAPDLHKGDENNG